MMDPFKQHSNVAPACFGSGEITSNELSQLRRSLCLFLKFLYFFNLNHHEVMNICKSYMRTAGWRIIWIIWYDDHPSYNSSPRSSHIWFSYNHNVISILSRVYNEPIQRPVPTWLVSSIGRALHRYRRGQGFVSLTSLFFLFCFFFRLSFGSCKRCVYNRDDLLSYIIQIIIFISILIWSIRFPKESPNKYAQKRCHL